MKARSSWCVKAGSHPVDGWPCDNLTHQLPSPLCVQLHKRINKRTRINSRPVASQKEQGGSRAAQNATVSLCYCSMPVPVYFYFFIMLCCPDFNNLQLGGRYLFFSPSKLSNHVSSLLSGWMKIWICHHGDHHIWFLFTCCHAPSIPITRHYNHQ